MTRIFPHDRPPRRNHGTIELAAARGETECAQIGIRTDPRHTEWSKHIRATTGDLKGPRGAVIPSACVDFLYPELVPVKWEILPPPDPGDVERPAPGFFPDPLIADWRTLAWFPNPPTRSVWVRVRVPRNAAPGVYRGSITVMAAEFAFPVKERELEHKLAAGIVGRVELTVRVWDFELPAAANILTTNWFFPVLAARGYQLAIWSAGFWRLLERLADDMAAHRQNCIFTLFFDAEHSSNQMVDVRRQGRRYIFDFDRFDRWCRLFFERGFRLIEGQHVAFRCHDATVFWLTGSGGSVRKIALGAQDRRYEDFLGQFMRALWEHLGRRGWRDRYVQHISDEPAPNQLRRYRRLAALVRQAAPGIKLMDAIGHPEYAPIIDYPVPLESAYEDLIRKSGRSRDDVWTYYCCGPQGRWPNRFIQYPLIRLRIIPWLCFQNHIPGILHWGYNYWKGEKKRIYNPWDDTSIHRYPCGDAYVVYPPRDDYMGDAITSSIRWEIIRKSLEDYEYLRLTRQLAEAGNAAARRLLKEVAARIAPDWTTHTRDYRQLLAIRQKMGALLASNPVGRRPI